MNADDLEILRAGLPAKHAAGPPEYAIRMLEETCARTGLDWKARQVYLIERGGKWRVELSIDGFRTVASRSPLYAGQAGPFWTTGPDAPWTDIPPDGKPYAAKVGIRLTNAAEPTWGVAKFRDYAAGPMWDKFASTMNAKVAEMLGLRKALPVELSGLYGAEEMDQSGQPRQPPEVAPVEERKAWAEAQAATDWLAEAEAVTDAGLRVFLDQLRILWTRDRKSADAARAVLVRRGLVR